MSLAQVPHSACGCSCSRGEYIFHTAQR